MIENQQDFTQGADIGGIDISGTEDPTQDNIQGNETNPPQNGDGNGTEPTSKAPLIDFDNLYNIMDRQFRDEVSVEDFRASLSVPEFRDYVFTQKRSEVGHKDPIMFNRHVVYSSLPEEDRGGMSFGEFNYELENNSDFRLNFFKNNRRYHGVQHYSEFQEDFLFPEQVEDNPLYELTGEEKQKRKSDKRREELIDSQNRESFQAFAADNFALLNKDPYRAQVDRQELPDDYFENPTLGPQEMKWNAENPDAPQQISYDQFKFQTDAYRTYQQELSQALSHVENNILNKYPDILDIFTEEALITEIINNKGFKNVTEEEKQRLLLASKSANELRKLLENDEDFKNLNEFKKKLFQVGQEYKDFLNSDSNQRNRETYVSQWNEVAVGTDFYSAAENFSQQQYKQHMDKKSEEFRKTPSATFNVLDPYTGNVVSMSGNQAATLYERAQDDGKFITTNESGEDVIVTDSQYQIDLNNTHDRLKRDVENLYHYEDSDLGYVIQEKEQSWADKQQSAMDWVNKINDPSLRFGARIGAAIMRGGSRFVRDSYRAGANLTTPIQGLLDSVFNFVGLTDDSPVKSSIDYTLRVMDNMARDVETWLPSPSSSKRGSLTTTYVHRDPENGKLYDIDITPDGKVMGVFNKQGYRVDPNEAFFKRLPSAEIMLKDAENTKINWESFFASGLDSTIDVASLILGARGGVGAMRLLGRGFGKATNVVKWFQSAVSQTNFIQAQLHGSLYQEGLDAGLTHDEANAYAVRTGIGIGIVSLLFGPTTQIIGGTAAKIAGKSSLSDIVFKSGKGFLTNAAMKNYTSQQLAMFRTANVMASMGGEALEEGLLEPLIQETSQRFLSPDHAQFKEFAFTDRDKRELALEGAMGGMIGGLLGAFTIPSLKREAIEFIEKNPEDFLRIGKRLGYDEDALQKKLKEAKEEMEYLRAPVINSLGSIDPNQTYTFTFDDATKIPKQFRDITPEDRVVVTHGNEQQITLKFSGKQLLEANLGTVDKLAVKEAESRNKIRSLQEERSKLLEQLNTLEEPIRRREEREQRILDIDDEITQNEAELEKLTEEKKQAENAPITPELNQRVREIKQELEIATAKRDEALEKAKVIDDLGILNIRFSNDGTVFVQTAQGQIRMSPEQVANLVQQQSGKTEITPEKIVSIAVKIKNNEQLTEDEQAIKKEFFDDAENLKEKAATFSDVVEQLQQKYNQTFAAVEQQLAQQKADKISGISNQINQKTDRSVKLKTQNEELTKEGRVDASEDVRKISETRRRLRELDAQIIETARTILPEIIGVENTLDSEKKRQQANKRMQEYLDEVAQTDIEDVSNKEYKQFKKDGTVSSKTLTGIALKLKNGEDLTTREREIYTAKQETIDNRRKQVEANLNGKLTEDQIQELQNEFDVRVITPEMRTAEIMEELTRERNKIIAERNTLKRRAREVAGALGRGLDVRNIFTIARDIEEERLEALKAGGDIDAIQAQFDREYMNRIYTGELSPADAAFAMEQAGRKRSNVYNTIKQLESEVAQINGDDALIQELIGIAKELVDNSEPDTVLFQDSMFEIENMSIEDINVDEARFQNREKLDEAALEKMVADFDRNQFDPPSVYKDPKDGKTYVISGHHRLEAAKRNGFTNIPVKIFEGDEQGAITYAKKYSNANRIPEPLLKRAELYRADREAGKPTKEIEAEAKRLERANWRTVLALASLNPNGKLIETLRAFINSEEESKEHLNKIAVLVGEARRVFPALTDSHEKEMFDYLLANYMRNGRIAEEARTKDSWISRIRIIQSSLFFDPTKPLNLNQLSEEKSTDEEYKAALKGIDDAIKEQENQINNLRARFNDPKAPNYINPSSPTYDEDSKLAEQLIEESRETLKRLRIRKKELIEQKYKAVRDSGEQLDLFALSPESRETAQKYPTVVKSLVENEKKTRAEESKAQSDAKKKEVKQTQEETISRITTPPKPKNKAKKLAQKAKSNLAAVSDEILGTAKKIKLSQVGEDTVIFNGVKYKIVTNSKGAVVRLVSDNKVIEDEETLIAVEVARNRKDYNQANVGRIIEQVKNNYPNIDNILENIWSLNLTETVSNALDKLYNEQPLSEEEALQVSLWLSDVFDRISKLIDQKNTAEEDATILNAYNTAEIINNLLYFSNNVTLNESGKPNKGAKSTKQAQSAISSKKSKKAIKSAERVVSKEQEQFDELINDLIQIMGEEAVQEMFDPLHSQKQSDAQALIDDVRENYSDSQGMITEEGKKKLIEGLEKLDKDYQGARRNRVNSLPKELRDDLKSLAKKLKETTAKIKKQFGQQAYGYLNNTVFGKVFPSVDYTVTYQSEKSVPNYFKNAPEGLIKKRTVNEDGEVEITVNGQALIDAGLGSEQTVEIVETVDGELHKPKNRKEVIQVFVSIFGMPIEKAQRMATMYDAIAEAWAKKNNKTKDNWYTERISGFLNTGKLVYNPSSEGSTNSIVNNVNKIIDSISPKARSLEQWIVDIVDNSDYINLSVMQELGLISLTPEWAAYNELVKERNDKIVKNEDVADIDDKLKELRKDLPKEKFEVNPDLMTVAQSFFNDNSDNLNYSPEDELTKVTQNQLMSFFTELELASKKRTNLLEITNNLLPNSRQEVEKLIEKHFLSATTNTFNQDNFIEEAKKLGIPVFLANKMAKFFDFKNVAPARLPNYLHYYDVLTNQITKLANKTDTESSNQRDKIIAELERVEEVINQLNQGKPAGNPEDVLFTTQDGSVFMVVGNNIVRADSDAVISAGSDLTLAQALAAIPVDYEFNVKVPTPEEVAGGITYSTDAQSDQDLLQALYGQQGLVANSIMQRIFQNTAKRMGISYDELRQKLTLAKGRVAPRRFTSVLNQTLNGKHNQSNIGSIRINFQSGPLVDFQGIPQSFLDKVSGLNPESIEDQLLYRALMLFPDVMKLVTTTKTTEESVILRKNLNDLQRQIGDLYKQGRGNEATAIKNQVKELKAEINALESGEQYTKAQIEELIVEKLKQTQREVNETDKYIITELSEEFIDSYLAAAIANGFQQEIDQWQSVKDNMEIRAEVVKARQEEQRNIFNESLNYLIGNREYPVGFTALAINEILTKSATTNYKKDSDGNIIRDGQGVAQIESIDTYSRTNKTYKEPIVINGANAGNIYQSIVDGSEDAISVIHERGKNLLYASPEEIMQRAQNYIHERRPDGIWIKIPKNGSDKVVEDLAIITRDTHRTGGDWCTGTVGNSVAKQHNQGGDFYIFIDNAGTVRLGARLQNNELGEPIRGLGKGQGVEPEMADEAAYFSDTNPAAKKYKKYTIFNKLHKKYVLDGQELDAEDIDNLLKYHNAGDGGYDNNTSKEKVAYLEIFIEDNIVDIGKKLGYKEDEIFLQRTGKEFIPKSTKLLVNFSGDLLLSENYPNLERVVGDLTIYKYDLEFPVLTTTGNINIEGDNTNLPSLTTAKDVKIYATDAKLPALTTAGTVDINATGANLPKLNTAGAVKIYSSGKGTNLPSLTTVTGDIFINGNDVNLSSLTTATGGILIDATGANLSSLTTAGEVSIDATGANLSKLNTTGDIAIYATGANLPSLTTATGVITINGKDAKLPKLTTTGDITINTTGVNLSSLTTAGNVGIYATGAKLPALTTATGNIIIGATDANLSSLTTAGGIRIIEADAIFPSLTTAGNVDIDATGAKLPKLNTAKNVKIYSSGKGTNLPSLTTAKNVTIYATDAKLPALTTANNVDIYATGTNLPALTTADNVDIHETGANLPKLTTATGNILIRATGASLPSLTTAGNITTLKKLKTVSPYLAKKLDERGIGYKEVSEVSEDDVKFQQERAVFVKKREKYYLYFGKNSDVSSPLHEAAHLYEEVLTKEERKKILKWAGHKKWTRETSEAFAVGFEKYLYEGTLDKEAEGIFKEFQRFLIDLIKDAASYFGGINELNDDMIAIYAAMVGDVNPAPQVTPRAGSTTLFQDSKNDSRVALHAMTNVDVDQPLQELAALFEDQMTTEEIRRVEKFTKEKYGTPAFTEKFSLGFVQYIMEGKSPNQKLETTFNSLSGWLQSIYNSAVQYEGENVRINRKMRDIYERMIDSDKAVPTKGVLQNLYSGLGNIFRGKRRAAEEKRKRAEIEERRVKIRETRNEIKTEKRKAIERLRNRVAEKQELVLLEQQRQDLENMRDDYINRFINDTTTPEEAQRMIDAFERISNLSKKVQQDIERVKKVIETPVTEQETAEVEREYQEKLINVVNSVVNPVNSVAGDNGKPKKPVTPPSGPPTGTPPSGPPTGTPPSGPPTGTPPSGPPTGTPPSGPPTGTPPSGPSLTPDQYETGKRGFSERMLRIQEDPRFSDTIKKGLIIDYDKVSFAKIDEIARWLIEEMRKEGADNLEIFEAAFVNIQKITIGLTDTEQQHNEARALRVAYGLVMEIAVMDAINEKAPAEVIARMVRLQANYRRILATELASGKAGTIPESLVSLSRIMGDLEAKLQAAMDSPTESGRTLREEVEAIRVDHSVDEIQSVLDEMRKDDPDEERVNYQSAPPNDGRDYPTIIAGIFKVVKGNLRKARNMFIRLMNKSGYDGAAIWEYMLTNDKVNIAKIQQDELLQRIIARKAELQSQLQANLDKAFNLFSAKQIAKISSKDLMTNILFEIQKELNKLDGLDSLDVLLVNKKIPATVARKVRNSILEKRQGLDKVDKAALEEAINNILLSISSDWGNSAEQQIRKGMRDLGMSLDEIVIKHYTQGTDQISLAEKLVRVLHFSPEEAREFQDKFQNTWNNMMREKKEQVLRRRLQESARILKNRAKILRDQGKRTEANKLEQQAKKYRKKKTPEIERMMQELSMGVADNDVLLDIWMTKYLVPNLNIEGIAKLTELAQKYYTETSSTKKREAYSEFMYAIGAQKTNLGTKILAWMQGLIIHQLLSGLTSDVRANVGAVFAALPNYVASVTALTGDVIRNPNRREAVRYVVGQTFKKKGTFKRIIRDVSDNLRYGSQSSRYMYTTSGTNNPFNIYMNRLLRGDFSVIDSAAYKAAYDKGGASEVGFEVVKRLTTLICTPFVIATRLLGTTDVILRAPLTNYFAAKKAYADLIDSGIDPSDAEFLTELKERIARNTEQELELEIEMEMEVMRQEGKKIPIGYKETRLQEMRVEKWDDELRDETIKRVDEALLMNLTWVSKTIGKSTGISLEDSFLQAFGKLILSTIFPIIRTPAAFVYESIKYTPLGSIMALSQHFQASTKDEGLAARETFLKSTTGIVGSVALFLTLFDLEEDEEGNTYLSVPEDWTFRLTGAGKGYIENKTIGKNWASNELQFRPFPKTKPDYIIHFQYTDAAIGSILHPLGNLMDGVTMNNEDKKYSVTEGMTIMASSAPLFLYQQSFSQSFEDIYELIAAFIRVKMDPSEDLTESLNEFNSKIGEIFAEKVTMLAPGNVRLYHQLEKGYNQIVDIPMKSTRGMTNWERTKSRLMRSIPLLGAYALRDQPELYDPLGKNKENKLILPHNFLYVNNFIEQIDDWVNEASKSSPGHDLLLSREDVNFPDYYNHRGKTLSYDGQKYITDEKTREHLRKSAALHLGRLLNKAAQYDFSNVSTVDMNKYIKEIRKQAIELAKRDVLKLGLTP